MEKFSSDLHAQELNCSRCNASSMEYCLKVKCPYYAVQNYTKEQRNYGSQISKRVK